jgi:2-polyprenyl-6-methoxyphenol hydroxylase-like FAD-dependent oxidoreductase
MMKNDNNVLVSGASVAGVNVAYWLARYGFKVTVVDRPPNLRLGGLQVPPRVANARARSGVLEIAAGRPAQENVVEHAPGA